MKYMSVRFQTEIVFQELSTHMDLIQWKGLTAMFGSRNVGFSVGLQKTFLYPSLLKDFHFNTFFTEHQ